MALVIVPTELGDTASVFWFRLGNLGRLHHVISPRHTLFVPPEQIPVTDDAFATRVGAWDACLLEVELDERGAIRQMDRREVLGRELDAPPELREESDALAERWRARRR
jgi:hypothetical protein